ncbi:GumC family protein [Sphingobium xenophagum]|uniref:GumC family protein n=1 Tax=Sphingobium xenophagum TaxID=121428 RepID=UPI001CB6CE98|nr:GNVR domain-containing protein [Sphingobium xenophagum]
MAGAIMALVIVWTVVQPRLYQSTASLLFDVSQPDPTLAEQERNASSQTALLGTQSDIIKSMLVARAVAVELARIEKWQVKPTGEALDRAATVLLGKVKVEPGKSTNVLDLTVTDLQPARSALLANLFTTKFLEKQRELRRQTARENAAWLNARTADVRKRLVEAQLRLADYQRARGIIGVNRMDLEAERLRSLNGQLAESEGESSRARSRAGNTSVPEVEFSGTVQELLNDVATQRAKIANMGGDLGLNHPEMVAARSQLGMLEQQLALARASAAQSLSAADQAARRRDADLRSRMVGQQSRMIVLSAGQQDLAILQQDVDAARDTYESVRRRFNEVAVRSQVSTTNVTQLDQATVPSNPFKPNIPLALFAGLVLSVMVGITVIGVLELLSPRVRTDEYLEQIGGRPVISAAGPGTV